MRIRIFGFSPQADQERPHGGAAAASEAVTALALPGRRPRPAEPLVQEDSHGVTPPAQGAYSYLAAARAANLEEICRHILINLWH